MPPATGIDEFDHAYKASAVSSGHWKPAPTRVPQPLGRGGFIPVRSDVAAAGGPACARLAYTGAFNCRPFRTLGPHSVEIASGVDTYDPVYYAVSGTLARPFHGKGFIYAMRAVGLLACAAAFWLAVYLTMSWARTRWPLAVLILASLPTTVYSTSLAAPNGLHLMSGLVVWSALVALLRGTSGSRTTSYASLSCGIALLATTHTLGILWIGLIALTLIGYAGLRAGVILVRPRSRAEWAWAGVAAAGILFQLWWVWYARPNDPSHPEYGLPGSPWPDIASSVILWPLQAIGAFPLRNDAAPVALYAMALVLLGALAVVGARALAGQWRATRMVAIVLFWTIAVPVGMTYLTYHQFGVAWQGRYGMPYAVGLFLIGAMVLDDRARHLRRPVIIVGTSLWVATHLVGVFGVLSVQRRDHELIKLTGWWNPPDVLILLLGVLACAAWLRALAVGVPGSDPTARRRSPH
jgi:hypothetical protein